MLKQLAFSVAIVVMLPAQAPTKAPRDFSLRLEFGCSGPDIVDTSAATYVREMSRGPQTAHVEVSAALKDQLFSLVNDARFFETSNRVTGLGICEPSTHYKLQVTSNGKTHIVSWDDCHIPTSPEYKAWLPSGPGTVDALRMRALSEEILKPFQAMGAVKRLRPSDMYCL